MNTETFEDRLLAKLTELDAARPTVDASPARRRMQRRLAVRVPVFAAAVIVSAVLVSAVLATAVLATAVLGIGAGGRTGPSGTDSVTTGSAVATVPVSFTVVKNADGTVTFTVHDLLDLSGATQALNDAGIVGRVVTSIADCTNGPNVVPINPADLYPPDTTHRLSKADGMTGGDSVTLRSSDYPPGGGLLVYVDGGYPRFRNPPTLRLFVGYLAYRDANKIPPCVNFVDPGTGQVPAWPPQPR
jgi:hypothetical protein